jgi:hypothetical protein
MGGKPKASKGSIPFAAFDLVTYRENYSQPMQTDNFVSIPFAAFDLVTRALPVAVRGADHQVSIPFAAFDLVTRLARRYNVVVLIPLSQFPSRPLIS